MADIMSGTANKAALHGDGPVKNAPPTPPDTQVEGNVKPQEPAAGLPPIVSEPLKTAGAPLIPSAIPAGTGPIPPPEVPATAGVDIPKAPGPVEDVQKKVAEAEKLEAQPEKPGDHVSSDAQPVNTVQAPTAQDAIVKEQPKPVSVEDVQDPELPVAKSGLAESAASKDAAMPDAPGATESAVKADAIAEPVKPVPPAAEKTEPSEKVTEPTAPAVQNATAEASATETTEPKVGEKRDADIALASATNGDATTSTTAVPDVEEPAEKKQRTDEAAEVGAANGAAAAPKRARSKKEKKPVAPVGRTARKTRSQGNVDL